MVNRAVTVSQATTRNTFGKSSRVLMKKDCLMSGIAGMSLDLILKEVDLT
jgi:hypothetical protein